MKCFLNDSIIFVSHATMAWRPLFSRRNIKITGVFLGILLVLMTNIIRSEETITTDWEIVDGTPTAWDFLAGEIRCEVANTGMHRILSKKTMEGDWIIETEIECSNNRSCPSQSIYFSIAEDYSYGYILTLKDSELILHRIVVGLSLIHI